MNSFVWNNIMSEPSLNLNSKAEKVIDSITQQNRDSYFKKKNTCFKQKIA